MYAFNMADFAAKKLVKHLENKEDKDKERSKIIQ